MSLFLVALVGVAAAANLGRPRLFYRYTCEHILHVPTGFKVITGAVLSDLATADEFASGLAQLRRRVRSAKLLDRKFAAYLYRLLSDELQPGLGEELFFEYLGRPGNQALAIEFAAEVIDIVKLELVDAILPNAVLTARIEFVIRLLRAAPVRLAPRWADAIDGFMAMQESEFGRAVANLMPPLGVRNPHADAIALLAELARPASRTIAELNLKAGPVFVTILRLDRWVRSEAGLTGPDYIDTIREHIFEMSRTCTTH